MPTLIEMELKRKAASKFPADQRRQAAYVYGTLRKMGWKPARENATGRKQT